MGQQPSTPPIIINNKTEVTFFQDDKSDSSLSSSDSYITVDSYDNNVFNDNYEKLHFKDVLESEKYEKKYRTIEEKDIKKFIFRINDDAKLKWDLIVMLGAIVNCIAIPLQVSFDP